MALLQPVAVGKSPRYREAAYIAIKDAILSGRLDPHLPLVEEQLAAMLAISRTPVREALAILEHEALIGSRGGRGLYVAAVTREQFVSMFIANETVEPYLVRRAALLITADQIAVLERMIIEARAAVGRGDFPGFLRASRGFHGGVGEAAGNPPLASFVIRNEERTDMYLLSADKAVDRATIEVSNDEHAAILGAIAARDPESAARLAVYHAQSLRDRLGDLFGS